MITIGHMMPVALFVLLLLLTISSAEHLSELEVLEGAEVGTQVGFIGDGLRDHSPPPYLIVPVGSAVDSDLQIDTATGEIRTKVPLDREARASYSLVAIPARGDNVRVLVKVLDENDNAPTFPTPVMHIEFPENTPRDVKRTLNPARDQDLDMFNTQRYNIVSGNVNDAFRLSSHRERDGVLYLDLQINGFLDRETTASYSLVIEALDGGTPPMRGEMTVNISIQDVNDNQPIFNQSRYFASIPENVTLGSSILRVFATDSDAGENGRIQYSINRRQSDREHIFRIDPEGGWIFVNKPVDFETKELHELVVVAKDNGLQPLETTTFVSIKITDVNDNQPTINVIFLSDDATPKISESAQAGEFIARISVDDPDSKTEYSNINVTLSGGEGRFGLTTRDNIIYLVVVSLPLDRELQPSYTLNVIATDTGNPPLHASRIINLKITDINDNAPEFEREVYYANVMEVSDPGTSVVQVIANDKDEGNNSAINYSLAESPDTHSSWFEIDSRSGLITTRAHVDCETDPRPNLTVVATDNGFPPLSSSVTVLVTIHDVNDNEPIFDQSFYNATLAENEEDRCILKVSATDPDCGINAMVNYTIGEGFEKLKELEVRSSTGDICITSNLDYETRNTYEFPVLATDRGGLSTTAIVKIQITDVNDNRPIFYPKEYNVSLREGDESTSATTPVVVVIATDQDSGIFGSVTYRIVSGNNEGLFRINRNSGEIFLTRPSYLSTGIQPYHRLSISARDGGNLESLSNAVVFISIIDSAQKPPIFEHSQYAYSVYENVENNTAIGYVKASVKDSGNSNHIRYSIYSGDPDGFFKIDSTNGAIRTASILDRESKANVLLNIQATSGDPPIYGHAQVSIEIKDINDNAPEFESTTVRISVPENVEVGVPLFAAHARDKDSDINGVIKYKISSTDSVHELFAIDPSTGFLTLIRHLDYELSPRHNLIITATDSGAKPLSANLSLLIEVQDVNDNAPIFEKSQYYVNILESLPINSQILQVTATDVDTGNNARLTYRILHNNSEDANDDVIGIFPNSGWMYLRESLDREVKDHYNITVIATDNGTPSETAEATVFIQIADANDNSPIFDKKSYEFYIEENLKMESFVGKVSATDADTGPNADITYSLIQSNTTFQINPSTGELTTKEPLDRERKETYEIVVEAKDQGMPSHSTRIAVKIRVLDVNDNAPDIVDPQEDVISVREEQPIGTEVARMRAVDLDNGYNASIVYSILNSKDSDGYGVFTIDSQTGVIRTKVVLDHEEKTIYRLVIAALDGGKPPKQTLRTLRVEVLAINDNRPTFTSSSLVFRVRENAVIGFVVGSVTTTDPLEPKNVDGGSNRSHITYTLSSLGSDMVKDVFDINRNTGSLVVARELDREKQSEYHLEVRALDTSTINNPQSSAVTVRVDIADVNDNPPKWPQDPITIEVREDAKVGTLVYNLSATDADSGSNSDLRYSLVQQLPEPRIFAIDALTGALVLTDQLNYENIQEYILIAKASDQSVNVSERLSTSVTLRLIVSDVNDNAPKFVLPLNTMLSVSKSLKAGMTVAHIMALDDDSGDNGRVTYVISNGNEDKRFSLGYDSGILTLNKPFPVNSTTYSLNITAQDHGIPAKQSNVKLTFSIQNDADKPQKFLKSVYQVNISEDAPVGTLVLDLFSRSGTSDGRNLSFGLPQNLRDTFHIDTQLGKITTAANLDRETRDSYAVPVFVIDTSDSINILFDTTTVIVEVADVNDNSPKFNRGTCYELSVPENSDTSVIHTVVAEDDDINKNGEITYSMTGGNTGNKFSINARSGELTAKALDRETHSRYHLTVTAHDNGIPALHSSCNITIIVEDQNDNDPKFHLSRYTTAIPEDTPVDTSILKVQATDSDVGFNARIVYSLANESQWLFRIDNKTGVITTTGYFDRERRSAYQFSVVATDCGRYSIRTHEVPVVVQITDTNDNKPIFTQYPFQARVSAYIQPGQSILTVTANDADDGTNSEIVYTLHEDEYSGQFRINPNTGLLSASQSLASQNGNIIYLTVDANDKGNPQKSSIGLIEIRVGNVSEEIPHLVFHNDTYEVTLSENAPQFHNVLQVSAVRTDGRKQKILYSFGTGNEENIFIIDSENGIIQVRDSQKLDYELYREIVLVIEAKTDMYPVIRGYCSVKIQLVDQNDNAPKFSQQEYLASVWEGNNKGAFVLQVVAFDKDDAQNSKVLYHIVDGNHDNAFRIEPAFSGILKTNIVLDKEIQDKYTLTVIATDEGVPQMTGTARVRINVVDVNDNRPIFPPYSEISVSEDVPVGTVLTTVKANDVDTFPPLTYRFSEDNHQNIFDNFAIDLFSGKIILKKRLDFEFLQMFKIKIEATDAIHIAQTILTIKVTDVNDNAPIFTNPCYQAALPDIFDEAIIDLLTVNTTDADSGENSQVSYSMVNFSHGFFIDKQTGIIKLNTSKTKLITHNVELVIKATDHGEPPLHSTSPVFITTDGQPLHSSSRDHKNYKFHVPEDISRGTAILDLGSTNSNFKDAIKFKIIEGNKDSAFEITISGTIIVIKSLDRENHAHYDLKITSEKPNFSSNFTTVNIHIDIDDVNDNAPVFKQDDYQIAINENLPIGTSIKQVSATDSDLTGINSDIFYDITSGNDMGFFHLHSKSGVLSVNKTLNYDTYTSEHGLVIRACDKAPHQLCTLNTLLITLIDENDNEPNFPVSEYLEFVDENEPIGTAVFTAHATDLDRGQYGVLYYSIVSINENDLSWKLFNIDSSTGHVTTATVFDFEQRDQYIFYVKASDLGGKSSIVKVRIEIQGKDEFYPQFTERTYRFMLATSNSLRTGYVVGQIVATDKDKGSDGRITYQLTTQHNYFKVNRTSGEILIKRKVENSELFNISREISLVVTASSGKQGSLTNMTVVEIILSPLVAGPGTNLNVSGDELASTSNEGITNWVLGLLIALIILLITFGAIVVFFHMRNKRNKKNNKPNLNNDSINTSNNYVDPSSFDTIPIRGSGRVVAGSGNQFSPPKYDEIPPYGAAHTTSSNSGAATTSELSGSEQSGSSGRGSAEDGEDGEDEEIRMINEGPLQRNSLHRQNNDADDLSDVPVRNTQEYLARLGIVNNASTGVPQAASHICSDPRVGNNKDSIHHHQSVPLDSLHMFDEDGSNENDITNLIYSKLNDVPGSDRASSASEGGGANSSTLGAAMDHVMAIGGYGDLTTVTHQPSMNGSLSSIVHNEEELAGSYNWDYLLDWGPQYQPLAHVFSEIARLKDDTASVKSAASGNSSVKSRNTVPPPKNLPPPLITSVAPRAIPMPMLNARSAPSHHTSAHNQMILLPRSPINHDASGGTFTTSTAMSPSFSPSLSPLATKSPSISPLVAPGLPTAHHVMSRQQHNTQNRKTVMDTELRI